MVVTGLEVAAAVFAIIGGFANCVKLVEIIKKRLRKRKAAAAPIEQATKLHSHLRGGGPAVDEEFGRLKKRGAQFLGIGNDRAPHALWSAYSLLQSLASELEPLSLQTDLGMVDFTRYQSMADRSQSLSVEALHKLADRLAAAGSKTSLLSGSTLASAHSGLSHRTQLNVHNICQNALQYRGNECTFDDVANRGSWSCKACGTSLSQVTGTLPSSDDTIWIGPAGLLKSHCTPETGRPSGWTCIWKVASRDCYHRFENEKALLKHMKTFHLTAIIPGQEARIDWPSDSRNWTADKCGYGMNIGGRKMQESGGGFRVPAA